MLTPQVLAAVRLDRGEARDLALAALSGTVAPRWPVRFGEVPVTLGPAGRRVKPQMGLQVARGLIAAPAAPAAQPPGGAPFRERGKHGAAAAWTGGAWQCMPYKRKSTKLNVLLLKEYN